MRVVAWNIRAGGGVRIESIGRALQRWRPDVVALSEFRGTPASQSLAARLAALGLAHQYSTVDADTPARNALLVASRWPLRRLEEHDAPNEPCRWLAVRVTGPVSFTLGAMHIPNRETGSKTPFHDAVVSVASRWRQQPAILAGDTNSGWPGLDEQVPCFGPGEANFLSALAAQGWADAWRHLHGQKRAYTWYSPNGNNGFRLDQAFVASPIAAHLTRASYVWGSRKRGLLSDHAALLVDLDIAA